MGMAVILLDYRGITIDVVPFTAFSKTIPEIGDFTALFQRIDTYK